MTYVCSQHNTGFIMVSFLKINGKHYLIIVLFPIFSRTLHVSNCLFKRWMLLELCYLTITNPISIKCMFPDVIIRWNVIYWFVKKLKLPNQVIVRTFYFSKKVNSCLETWKDSSRTFFLCLWHIKPKRN